MAAAAAAVVVVAPYAEIQTYSFFRTRAHLKKILPLQDLGFQGSRVGCLVFRQGLSSRTPAKQRLHSSTVPLSYRRLSRNPRNPLRTPYIPRARKHPSAVEPPPENVVPLAGSWDKTVCLGR